MPLRCRACKKKFSVKMGTAMESSNLGYQKWALALYLINTNLKGVSSMKLHRDLKITQKSAWHLAHRLREGLRSRDDVEFAGPVEVDKTYMDGKEKNKHKSKKLKAGRGAVGKVAVLEAKDRDTNAVSATVLERTDGVTLKGFVNDRTVKGARSTRTSTRAIAVSRTMKPSSTRSASTWTGWPTPTASSRFGPCSNGATTAPITA